MVATLRSLTASIGRLKIGSQIQPQTISVVSAKCQLLENEISPTHVNSMVPCRGRRMHFKGFRRDSPYFYHYMREDRHMNPKAWLIKSTRDPRLRGNIFIYDENGDRTGLKVAEEKFKRLDWGAFINVPMGRSNKFYKKKEYQKWKSEQHIFPWFNFSRKLERMFTPELKRKRYFVDDPYEKYHKMSWIKYRASVMKNVALIKEHANNVYKFDRYRMHNDYLTIHNKKPHEYYTPPGFLKTIKDTGGAYIPEGENKYTEPDWMAPHFQRTKIRQPDFVIDQKHFNKKGHKFHLDSSMQKLRIMEHFSGRLKPWSRVMHKMRY